MEVRLNDPTGSSSLVPGLGRSGPRENGQGCRGPNLDRGASVRHGRPGSSTPPWKGVVGPRAYDKVRWGGLSTLG